MAPQFKSALIVFAFFTLGWISLCAGQSPQTPATTAPPADATSSATPPSAPALPSSISGTVVDQDGAVVPGAHVHLTGDAQSLNQDATTGKDGQFSFNNVPPGHFQLTVTAAGFSSQTYSALLQPDQIETVPPIALAVAANVTEVQVTLTQTEVAEQQIKVEEQQRILGAIPNFFVSYTPDAVPLTSKQKFKLSWKSVIDPVTFLMVGGAAGVEQAQNHFNGYGQGAEGYASVTAQAMPTRSWARFSVAPFFPRSSSRILAISTRAPGASRRVSSTPSATLSSARATMDTGNPATQIF